MDTQTVPVRVAYLALLAEDEVRSMGERIIDEFTKERPVPPPKAGDEEAEPCGLRVVCATVTRVSDITEWEAFQKRLVTRMRDLLDKGFEVELT